MRNDLRKKTPEQLRAMLKELRDMPYVPQPKAPVASTEYQSWRKDREERSTQIEAIEIALAGIGHRVESRFPDLPAPQRRLAR